MLSTAFRQFETDPFFDFGNSPFGRSRGSGGFFQDDLTGEDPLSYSRHYPRRSQLLPPEPEDPAAPPEAAAHHRALVQSSSRPPAAATAAGSHGHHQQLARRPAGGSGDLMEFPSMMGGGFGIMERHFNEMFTGMNRMMADMSQTMRRMEEAASRDDFDGHVYTHASVYSRRSDPEGGDPHVYEAMAETRAAPGGVRETRRAMRDSRTREERAAHGRHIGVRGHVVERRRNGTTGEQHEDHNYSGVAEAESEAFDREWHSRATALAGGRAEGRGLRGSRSGRELHDEPTSRRPASASGKAATTRRPLPIESGASKL